MGISRTQPSQAIPTTEEAQTTSTPKASPPHERIVHDPRIIIHHPTDQHLRAIYQPPLRRALPSRQYLEETVLTLITSFHFPYTLETIGIHIFEAHDDVFAVRPGDQEVPAVAEEESGFPVCVRGEPGCREAACGS